jgi:hypothetical protein
MAVVQMERVLKKRLPAREVAPVDWQELNVQARRSVELALAVVAPPILPLGILQANGDPVALAELVIARRQGYRLGHTLRRALEAVAGEGGELGHHAGNTVPRSLAL